jgi:hypothetical protein
MQFLPVPYPIERVLTVENDFTFFLFLKFSRDRHTRFWCPFLFHGIDIKFLIRPDQVCFPVKVNIVRKYALLKVWNCLEWTVGAEKMSQEVLVPRGLAMLRIRP